MQKGARMKHIIFDVDGTLIDTSAVHMMGLKKALESVGIEKSLEDLLIYDGMPGAATLQALNIQKPQAVMEKWLDYVSCHREDFYVYQGIFTVLKVLSRAGLALSIVTSRTEKEIFQDPYMLELLPYFDQVISADQTERHKPNPAPILEALNRVNIDKKETVYIGDSIHDYKAASAAGIQFYKAEWGKKSFDGPKVKLDYPVAIIKALS